MATLDLQVRERLAHPGMRFLAYLIDLFVVLCLSVFLQVFFTVLIDEETGGLISAIVVLLYFLFADALPQGQSLGKKLLRMQVVNEKTMRPCSIFRAFLRKIALMLGILDWAFIFFGERQRLGDILASTLVLKTCQKRLR